MTASKIVLNAASGVGGAGPDVDEVFSTYLYDGTNATQTITNGIDLAGEGGLVWCKSRNQTYNHGLVDTERGVNRDIMSNDAGGENLRTGNFTTVSAFNSNGFSLGPDAGSDAFNKSSTTYVSWAFRKAEKFFDVVTYTGTGSNRTISHNLGTTPGMIIVKQLNGLYSWRIWHRSLGNSKYIRFQTDTATTDSSYLHWSSTAHTDTTFSVGTNVGTNESNSTYVAYLFAHNNNDGEFGPDADQDIIKCGSYTGNGSSSGVEVDLGFEPQWVLTKSATQSSTNWTITDTMRGWPVGSGQTRIRPHTNAADLLNTTNLIDPLPDGFKVFGSGSDYNSSSQTYIYIAIRRGSLAPPEAATEVFDVNKTTSNQFVTTGFPVDLQLGQYTGGGSTYFVDRMRGMSTSTTGSMKYLTTQTTNAEASNTGSLGFNGFVQNGFSHTLGNYEQALWSWKRAPNYFDVVAYTGTGSTRTVAHNLGAAPEMMWFKGRNQSAYNWMVYHKNISPANGIYLSDNGAASGASFQFANTAPTATVFTVGSGADVNNSNEPYIAYLFASLDGISKVGSYTGTGAAQDIDCGFTSGARFILLKQTSGTGNWYVFDSVRGIVAGNDPYLYLNSTNAQVTSRDGVDPLSSGFALTTDATFNASGATYIFYAIA